MKTSSLQPSRRRRGRRECPVCECLPRDLLVEIEDLHRRQRWSVNKLAEFIRIELIRRQTAVRRLPTRYTLRTHFSHAPLALRDLVELPLIPNERDATVRKLSDLRTALSDREIDARFGALIAQINDLASYPNRQAAIFAELREQWREIDALVKRYTLSDFLRYREKRVPRKPDGGGAVAEGTAVEPDTTAQAS